MSTIKSTAPRQPARPIRIIATGSYVPAHCVTSQQIDQRTGQAFGTTQQITGIQQRYFAGEETSSQMAAKAAIDALRRADLKASDLDLIVSACAIMEQPIPTQSVLIQQHLGLAGTGTATLDLNATCLSFLSAFDTVSYLVASGRYQRALIVSSEIPSRGLDWNTPEICGNFGDGAAAVIIEQAGETTSAILGAHFETYCEGAQLNELQSGGTGRDIHKDLSHFLDGAVFKMNGPASYKLATKLYPKFLKKSLTLCGCDLNGLDLVIPHQASVEALDRLVRLTRAAPEKVVNIIKDYGNQISVSIPMALHHAIVSDKLHRGDTALLTGTAAGLSLGAMVVRY
ncbi:3-oxoacyl-[acyl-carrier-protein] synthase III C-terminal domain-containing protein [Terasakiella pusilla]|uniref:3-oxoacyl-[acyl-carrier-protein] synthase III C-terminal domain-containing protein n=1 Tax=Terasakiella pusilla TaxID=64973 RepID=UPI003AA8781E